MHVFFLDMGPTVTSFPPVQIKTDHNCSLHIMYIQLGSVHLFRKVCCCHPRSPPQQHLTRSGWSCLVVWPRHSARLSQWCGAQRGCLPSLRCHLASDCRSATWFKSESTVTWVKSPKVTNIQSKKWRTMPSSTLKPSWYLGSGLLMIAMVTGGQWTMLSFTYFWFFRS